MGQDGDKGPFPCRLIGLMPHRRDPKGYDGPCQMSYIDGSLQTQMQVKFLKSTNHWKYQGMRHRKEVWVAGSGGWNLDKPLQVNDQTPSNG